jgi:hypothetical protein
MNFTMCISQAVKSGEKIYVVEQKSETYNFFVDIDYKDARILWVSMTISVTFPQVICETVKFAWR